MTKIKYNKNKNAKKNKNSDNKKENNSKKGQITTTLTI